MKTIIAGSRTLSDFSLVEKVVSDSGFEVTEVVSGCAPGIDQTGMKYAVQYGIPIKRMPVLPFEWQRHGRVAGFLRNKRMAEYSEALIAVWDGKSAGTRNMINEARKLGLKVHVHIASPVT